MLGVGPSERVMRLSRLRLASGKPMAIEHAVVPCRFLPDLDAIGASLYDALEARHFRPARGLERLRATLLSDADAALLEVEAGAPRSTSSASPISRTGNASNSRAPIIVATPMTSCRNSRCPALRARERASADMSAAPTHMLNEIAEAGDVVARQLARNGEAMGELGRRLREARAARRRDQCARQLRSLRALRSNISSRSRSARLAPRSARRSPRSITRRCVSKGRWRFRSRSRAAAPTSSQCSAPPSGAGAPDARSRQRRSLAARDRSAIAWRRCAPEWSAQSRRQNP